MIHPSPEVVVQGFRDGEFRHHRVWGQDHNCCEAGEGLYASADDVYIVLV